MNIAKLRQHVGGSETYQVAVSIVIAILVAVGVIAGLIMLFGIITSWIADSAASG